jgi:hypothetical protein
MNHYTPRGERSTWSKAQYTVYKEEKAATRKERWAARKSTLNAIAKDINQATSSKYRSITDGNRNRTVLGQVAGRKNGQPAIEKDSNGIPIVEKAEREEDSAKDDDESSSEEEGEVQTKGEKEAGPSTKKGSKSSSKQDIVPVEITSSGLKDAR